MSKRKFPSVSTLLVYLTLFAAMFFFYYIGLNGEPFSLAILFASFTANLNPFACSILYVLSSLSGFRFSYLPYYAIQAFFVFLGFFFKRRFALKTEFAPFLALFFALLTFVFRAPFVPYVLPFENELISLALTQKAVIASIVFLLSATASVALKAILYKFLRCRLRAEEILFSCLLVVLVGIGLAKAASLYVYLGVALFALLLFVLVTKDASGLLCAFLLSLPPYFSFSLSFERFFLFGVATVLTVKYGRLPEVFSLMAAYFLYAYYDGVFSLQTKDLTNSLLAVLVPSLLFILLPQAFVHRLENKLVFYREKHLSRVAINRNRTAIGQQLFELSGVFREIETTFSSLGSTEAQDNAKDLILSSVIGDVCKKCPEFVACETRHGRRSLRLLVDVACAKGRASLIDLPRELSEICADQSGVLYSLNKKLADYRKYTMEAESAGDGRKLLAGQAQGVSEILKNVALEQSEPLLPNNKAERQIELALLKTGIVCYEIMLVGDDDPTLSIVTSGKPDVKKIARIASDVLKLPMTVSEKLSLGKDKYCSFFRKKPYFDAAFGIASKTKSGESASGDTYSVVKIDERRFMIALSDGMGSGEYARKVSECTVSLLESFYRAKMPPTLVLTTINKLLSFSKDETFACVDIAIVDLDSGRSDVVKIGSPIAFILSGQTLKILESASLPLGILETLRPDSASYDLKEGDVLLFLSDGVASAFPSPTDLYDAVKRLPATNPQQLADSLLERALGLYDGNAKDDMTVLAVRLFGAA